VGKGEGEGIAKGGESIPSETNAFFPCSDIGCQGRTDRVKKEKKEEVKGGREKNCAGRLLLFFCGGGGKGGWEKKGKKRERRESILDGETFCPPIEIRGREKEQGKKGEGKKGP